MILLEWLGVPTPASNETLPDKIAASVHAGYRCGVEQKVADAYCLGIKYKRDSIVYNRTIISARLALQTRRETDVLISYLLTDRMFQ